MPKKRSSVGILRIPTLEISPMSLHSLSYLPNLLQLVCKLLVGYFDVPRERFVRFMAANSIITNGSIPFNYSLEQKERRAVCVCKYSYFIFTTSTTSRLYVICFVKGICIQGIFSPTFLIISLNLLFAGTGGKL